MKRKWILLIGALFSGLLGWVLGYLRLPTIGGERFFFFGVLSTISFLVLIFLVLFISRNHTKLIKWISEEPVFKSEKVIRSTYLKVLISLGGIILLGSILSIYLLNRQEKIFKSKNKKFERQFQEQSVQLESLRQGNKMVLVSSVLEKIREEMNDAGKLSSITISNIVNVCSAIKPYRYFEKDTLSTALLSPERGQLLKYLLASKMDSTSFSVIKNNASFQNTDLEETILTNLNLNEVDLKGSNFSEAQLDSSTFENANLRNINFWGAQLVNTSFKYADLTGANLSWADLYQADFAYANLTSADLSSTKMKNANLKNVKMRWSNLNGALFNGADLDSIDLAGSDMKRVSLVNAVLTCSDMRYLKLNQADLRNSDLTKADLKYSILEEVNLSGVKLDSVEVDIKNWFEQLTIWRVVGVQDIKRKYSIVKNTEKEESYFILRKD